MIGARVFATARLVIAAAAGVTVCSSRLESVPTRQVQRASGVPAVDSVVEVARSELALPAVSIAIMRGRALLVAKGYGLADRESRVPPSERTIYPIGSLSKQITAAAVMKLVEQGQIRLDEPLATYVPEYRPTSGQMPSIRQLLLQTSGIPAWDDLPDMQDIDSGNADRFTRSRMLDVLGGRSRQENRPRTPRSPEPVLRDLPVQAAERARSIGNYDDGMFKFKVYQQGEELYVDVPPLGPPLRLRYQGAHEFATPEPSARSFRFEPAEGPVERVDWEWAELRAFGRRVQ